MGFIFTGGVEFFTSPDSVFDNFNDRRILMDRQRGETVIWHCRREHDGKVTQSSQWMFCDYRFGLVLQLMSTLNYTSSTEL